MKRKKPTKTSKRKSAKLLQRANRRFGWALMVGVVGLVVVFGYLAVRSSFAGTNVTRHFIQNVDGVASQRKTQALGFNVVDVGPDAKAVNALPAGQQAMVWVGNTKCGSFDVPYAAFTSAVDKLAHNPKVYGWYLSDGPSAGSCPKIVAEIKRRADYIHAHAPGQKSYIATAKDEYAPLKPSLSHVDVFGLDPYPCQVGRACDLGLIDSEVAKATAAGIPREAIAPIYQLFGQACAADAKNWRLPTEAEAKAMLTRWDKALPHAPMDVAYSWNRQSNYACQTLADANGAKGYPDLQSIMKDHNATKNSQPVVTAPPATKTPAPTPTLAPVATVTPKSDRPDPRPILTPTPTPAPTATPVVTTPPHVGDTAAPTKPGGFRAAIVIDRFAVLAWEPSQDNRKVQGYRLYRDGVLVSDQRSTLYIDVKLSSNTSYTYEVEAYDAAKNVSQRAQVKVKSKVASAAPAAAAAPTPVPSSAPAAEQPLGITPSGVDQPVEIPAGLEPDVSGIVDVMTPGPADSTITPNDGGAGPDEVLADDTGSAGDGNLTDSQVNDGQGAMEGDVTGADISADEATANTELTVGVDGGTASTDGQLDTTYLTNGAHEVSVSTTKANGTKTQSTRTVKVQNSLTPIETVRNQIFAGFHGNKQLVNNTMTGLAALLALLLIGVSSWAIRRWVMGGKRFGKVSVL
ncbi:MAG: chitinase [Patescibacteria group bacterium]|nr:chitinase [Patescibacteria group bacterium]